MTKNILEQLGIIDPTGNEQFEEATPPSCVEELNKSVASLSIM